GGGGTRPGPGGSGGVRRGSRLGSTHGHLGGAGRTGVRAAPAGTRDAVGAGEVGRAGPGRRPYPAPGGPGAGAASLPGRPAGTAGRAGGARRRVADPGERPARARRRLTRRTVAGNTSPARRPAYRAVRGTYDGLGTDETVRWLPMGGLRPWHII